MKSLNNELAVVNFYCVVQDCITFSTLYVSQFYLFLFYEFNQYISKLILLFVSTLITNIVPLENVTNFYSG